MSLRTVSLDELRILDERAFEGVALYGALKRALIASGQRFRILESAGRASWDRALFLNLTFWNAEDESADVLCEPQVPADVIAHVAWHGLVSKALAGADKDARAHAEAGAASAEALFFAESIASAFDLYLVGRLLPIAADSDFVTTQVPLLAERAEEAGASEASFSALMDGVTRDPERAFEDLRELLFDAATAVFACAGAEEAEAALARFAGHRFAPLLHHFELSNWILYARAYAARPPVPDLKVRELDALLRAAPVALDWLAARWLER